MSLGVTGRVRTCGVIAVAMLALGLPARAHAQTTLVLQAPDTQSVDTFIRGGSYAGKNYNGSILVTRASSNTDYVRRALLKFNTASTIPSGASISSAKLTLTVHGGYSTTRLLSAYRVSSSFDEQSATWTNRSSSSKWGSSGGDYGSRYAQASVYGPGTKVTFDVTKLVQDTVNGAFGSRYTRVAILDTGTSSNYSYREFYSSEASDSSLRPTLKVTYGGSTTSTSTSTTTSTSDVSATSTSSSSSTSIKVLEWNTHHGGIGTDGVYSPSRLAGWIAKINPDVVALSEVDTTDAMNYIVSALDAKTGITWHTSYSGKGNLALSKLPLDYATKCLYDANIPAYAAQLGVTMNGRAINLWAIQLSVYSGSARLSELKTLESCASNWPEARILAGDFNMQYGSTEYYQAANYYKDAWLVAKAEGTAYNYSGNCDGCTRNSRIDYVFSSKGATFLAVKSARIFDTRDSNGVMPSDHKPLLVTYAVN